ncbi:MAG: hypothetical protein HYY36_03060 [Gammaproteobacteria bacterium]|nr:hypothetical protein [Gammaproteobacteria bacterium]
MDLAGLSLSEYAELVMAGIDFDETVLNGLLSFLLFAGALKKTGDRPRFRGLRPASRPPAS